MPALEISLAAAVFALTTPLAHRAWVFAARKRRDALRTRLAEQRLRARRVADSEVTSAQQRGLFELILGGMSEGVAIADRGGKYVLVNSAARRIIGVEAADVLPAELPARYGMHQPETMQLIAEEDLVLRRALRGETAEHEVVFRNAERVRGVRVRASARPIHDGDGEIAGAAVILDDVTELRRAEAEQKGLLADLEERRARLERLTYTVSHDLKSPLITIRGFLGLVARGLRGGDLERVRADLERITAAVELMFRLLAELEELSRLGRPGRPRERVALGEVAREAAEHLADRYEDRRIRLDISAVLPEVLGDRLGLYKVFQNLLGNAAKFTGDQAEPRVEVGSRTEADRVVCFVRDNGIGIEPRFQERVFGLFDRLDPGTEGTGVGLTLVREIIEDHGGEVWVESAGLGHGSTFAFSLPRDPG